jgi:hypothetical protein
MTEPTPDPVTPPVVPTPDPVTPPVDSTDITGFTSLIPEEYKQKPYLQNIKSVNDLFKSYDNAQTLIGKKTIGIPDEKSTPEEVSEFYIKLGKPAEIDTYEFTSKYPEIFGEEKGKSFDKRMKEVFHKSNLTSKQVKDLQENMAGVSKEIETELQTINLSKEQEVITRFEKILTEDKEKVVLKASKVLETFIDEKDILSEVQTNLDAKSKIILSSVLSKVYDKYMKDDKLPTKNIFSGGESVHDINQQISELLTNPVYYSPMDNGYKAIRDKMRDLQTKKNTMISDKKI